MVVDDLADGAVRHQFTAGGLVVTADYWTTRDKRDWTAPSVKPVTLNLSAEGADEVSLTAIQVQVERLTGCRMGGGPSGEHHPAGPGRSPRRRVAINRERRRAGQRGRGRLARAALHARLHLDRRRT